MAISLNFFANSVAAATGNGVPAGVFIPQATDLPGLTSAELGSSDPQREVKVAFALCNQLTSTIPSLSAPLGVNAIKQPTAPGGGVDLVNLPYQFVIEWMLDLTSRTMTPLPLPTSESGKITIANVFPNAAIVAAEGAIAAAGIVVPSATIAANGGTQPANVNAADARGWIAALIQELLLGIDPTNDAVAAATVGNVTGFAPRAAFTATTNPTTNLTAADLPKRKFFSITQNLTFRVSLNNATQTFELVNNS